MGCPRVPHAAPKATEAAAPEAAEAATATSRRIAVIDSPVGLPGCQNRCRVTCVSELSKLWKRERRDVALFRSLSEQ